MDILRFFFILRMNLWSVEYFLTISLAAISFIKIRFSCNSKYLRDTFFTLSECLSNVLISGEFNFDEKNGQEMLNWSEVLSLKQITS